MNTTARKARSSIAVAGTGVLLAAAVLTLAPVASAAPADSGPPSLAVSTAAPAEIGLAGQPVPFTSTVTNTGASDVASVRLAFRIATGTGVPPHAAGLEYRLGGTAWKTVTLAYADGVFSGEVPQTFPLAAGASRTVQLRLGMPMGTPHNGATNGGTQQVKLTTTASTGGPGAAGHDEDTVRVDGLTAGMSGVPRTAVAGGAPLTFTASVTNPSASAFENVTGVLFTNRHTSVQVLRAGRWTNLKAITSAAEPDVYGYDIVGKDASMAPHSRTTVTVRLAYRANAPLGTTTVNPCAIVNQSEHVPFQGTTDCGASAVITVKAAGSSTSPSPSASASATPSATPTATASGTTSGTTSGTGSTSGTTAGDGSALARTGSGGTTTAAAVGGVFVLAGAGAVGYVALRRRTGA